MTASPQRSPETSPAPSAQFTQALRQAARNTSAKLHSVSVPAPICEIGAVAQAWPAHSRVLWKPPEGIVVVGTGCAASIVAEPGSRRFAEIARKGRELLGGIARGGEEKAPEPRLLGGFSFFSERKDDPSWEGFGVARFWLPRWRYASSGSAAYLTYTGSLDPEEQILQELEARWHELINATHTPVPKSGSIIREQSEEQWSKLVERAIASIDDQPVRKIVVARRTDVRAEAESLGFGVAAELGSAYPACFRFAFEHDGKTFAGASPERLIAKNERSVSTQALAGSIANQPSADQALLSSNKDRIEQDIVVQAIKHTLAEYCDEVHVAEVPKIRRLETLLHLSTPIAGTLRREEHIATLCGALHPTPAVGGAPKAESVEWLSCHEGFDRGWYAAPVGWFDEAGDGEFAVAIRSALFAGDTVQVYAGAGIVRDSVPLNEYRETGLKLRVILEML